MENTEFHCFLILNTTDGGFHKRSAVTFLSFFKQKMKEKFAGYENLRTFASAFNKNA